MSLRETVIQTNSSTLEILRYQNMCNPTFYQQDKVVLFHSPKHESPLSCLLIQHVEALVMPMQQREYVTIY